MRIWTLHPTYLDAKGIVALWRETLLAKHVLEGKTRGYREHPQLIRFKNSENPLTSINYYLSIVYQEAQKRGYHFSREKFSTPRKHLQIKVTIGQLEYEFAHLMNKLKTRDPVRYQKNKNIEFLLAHPLFNVVVGEIENWEKTK